MILSGQTIRRLQMVSPHHERTEARGMTFGLGPAGYDIRIAETMVLVPGSFRLASAIEYFRMPDDVLGKVHDKSTWARRGLAAQNTVIEPGWRGYLTLELTNHGDEVIQLIYGMPIVQVVFQRLDEPTEIPYRGRYQNQAAGPQAARLLAGGTL